MSSQSTCKYQGTRVMLFVLTTLAEVSPRLFGTLARPSTSLVIILTLILTLNLTPTPTLAFTKSPCCRDGEKLLQETNMCLDHLGQHSRANISCKFYKMDPNEDEEDTFTELPGGSLLVGDSEDNFTLPIGSFCIGLLKPANSKMPVPEHLVALACFDDFFLTQDGESSSTHVIYGTCMLVSAVFLLLTLLMYGLLPELRDLQGQCLMANVLSLLLAYLPLSMLQFYGRTLEETTCELQAFFIYFWLLSAFFWLNVVCFNVWRSVLDCRLCVREDRLMLLYASYAWGLPMVFLALVIVAHIVPENWNTVRPRFGEDKCWFKGPEETWSFFYGPVAVLLILNVGFFASTAYRLWSNTRADMVTRPRIRSQRFKCILYLKLFLVMGITWIFELISYITGPVTVVWFVTDLINCLQGVLIFLVVVCRKRTFRAIARRPWGSICPEKLVKGVDEESEAMLAEDLELSQALPTNNLP